MMKGILMSDDATKQRFLHNVLYFAIVNFSGLTRADLEDSEHTEFTINEATEFLNVRLGDVLKTAEVGVSLSEKFKGSKVFVGIRTEIFWDFYKNPKDEFDWECLFAFLSFKSIVGRKKFCASNNTLLFARMSGCESVSEYDKTEKFELSRRKLDRVKLDLQLNWNLVYYSSFTRGFYFGFDIMLDDLVFHAESRKKSTKVKDLQEAKKEALRKANLKLKAI